jgi:hypothetical protein
VSGRGESSKLIADRLLRRGLERLSGSGPVLIPEYPLELSARWGWGRPVMSAVAARLKDGEEAYVEPVDDVCAMAEWAGGIPREQRAGGDPCWENDYWGSLDALFQCASLKRRDPALYLEIGSGFSTLFARRAITDFGLRTRIVSIDPEPRSAVNDCCDEVVRRPLQDVDPALLERLAPGDVVLFDGSHVALMNSDATVFFLELLPKVPPGVLVGVDDVFLPSDYPPSWAGRIYGEQYLLAAHLLGGGAGWDVRFPAWWLVEHSTLAERFDRLWPTIENRFGRHAGSFWFERV